MRGATDCQAKFLCTIRFQSTLLMRGATPYVCERSASCQISIHAPHARSDDITRSSINDYIQFQSTLLMRGATLALSPAVPADVFQSTLLMRGATLAIRHVVLFREISIHAPHARSDTVWICRSSGSTYFNPRSSCEERHHAMRIFVSLSYFNPRSSCEERHAAV